MKLGDLLPGLPEAVAGISVSDVTADSRTVTRGALFVALPGSRADGRQYVSDAARAGAVAAIVEGSMPAGLPADFPVIAVGDARATLAAVAMRFLPRQPAVIAAVTGTSGKTSVAEFTRQIFAACGKHAASIGTLGIITAGGEAYGSLTTPDTVTLHRTLYQLSGEGVTHLAMEASSHGLDQKRLDGVRLAAVGFTNLRRDHLDYHPSVEAYCEAKLRLFRNLAPQGAGAVVNADGEFADRFESVARERGLRLITVGAGGRDLVLEGMRREGFAQTLFIGGAYRARRVRLPLIGDYQASNALVASGLAVACGLEMDQALDSIEKLAGVSGRLEIIGQARGGLAVVDYAHKPDALEAALAAVRPFVTGKLICVFGCGGNRDRGKRPIMGAIAQRAADVAIVTDDNPRSEDPAAIRAEILAGAPGAREIGDRAEAIREGVRLLAEGDVLIVAGKGHETGQIVGDRTLPFSDQEVVRAELREYQ